MTPEQFMVALLADRPAALAKIAAEKARHSGIKSFATFVQQAWSQVDASPLQWGWHLQAICDHLEEVYRGNMRRLMINLPPRSGKSNIISILFPAWVWINSPTEQFIYLSYSDDLAREHSIKCRMVVESQWYQSTYRPSWKLAADQNTKHDFLLTSGGRRLASSIKSGVTGRGATFIIADDPLSAEEAPSAAARETARRVIQQVVGSRFNDPKTGRFILAMQRVHADDPSTWARDAGCEPLVLPTEFDPARRARTFKTLVNGHIERVPFWEDPRTEEGELLFPERISREVLADIRKTFSSVAYAAQHQQQPLAHAMAGAYFRRAWFKILEETPKDIASSVRRWDLASTEGGGDWTVGVKLARLKTGGFVVMDVVRAQHSPRRVRDLVMQTAQLDGRLCSIVIPQDPGQAGVQQVEEYTNMLAGYTCRFPRETGDKVTRSGPASAQAEAGNVSLVRAAWNSPFLESLEAFPDEAVHDDDVDAFAGAVSFLALGDTERQQRYMAAAGLFSKGKVQQ